MECNLYGIAIKRKLKWFDTFWYVSKFNVMTVMELIILKEFLISCYTSWLNHKPLIVMYFLETIQ